VPQGLKPPSFSQGVKPKVEALGYLKRSGTWNHPARKKYRALLKGDEFRESLGGTQYSSRSYVNEGRA